MEFQHPKVSIILPTYNGARYIRQGIESCLNQTYKNFELIVVDDCSSDQTSAIVNAYNDSRLYYLKNDKNKGIAYSLNIGFAKSTGGYLTWTSDDNYYQPVAIEQLTQMLDRNTGIDFVYSNYYYIDEHDNIIKLKEVMPSDKLVEVNCIGPCFLFRRNVYTVIGKFNEEMFLAEDYDYWVRVSQHFKMQPFPIPLYYYRIHADNLTSKYSPEEIAEQAERVKDKYFTTVNDYFFRAKFLKKTTNRKGAKRLLIKSLILNPFKLEKWNFLLRLLLDRNTINFLHRLMNHLGMKCPLPQSFTFIMIDKCSARCIMCGIDYNQNNNPKELSFDKYLTVFEHMPKKVVKDITFSGGGEPLLNKDLLKIIRFTRNSIPNVNLSIYTNGIMLTEEISTGLLENDFKEIIISINAATPETYFQIARVNAFNTVIKNVKALVKLKKNLFKNTKIQFSFVALQKNISELPKLVKLAAEVDVDSVHMQYCRFYSQKYTTDLKELNNEALPHEESLYFCQDLSDKLIKNSQYLARELNIEFMHEPCFNKAPSGIRCTWPFKAIFVYPDGTVFPCGGGEIIFNKAIYENKLYFGNLLQNNIETFWNNEAYKLIRQSCNMRNKTIPQCNNCNYTIWQQGVNNKKSHFIEIV
ncbi:MAG: glycosyltransferase [Candidatus Omnitrophota bacterium]